MDTTTTKIIAIFIILITSVLFGIIPKYTRKLFLRLPHSDILISSCLCFGGGVLMATVFLHLFVEVKEGIDHAMEEDYIPHTHYPLAYLIICAGFFLIYLLEEVVHVCVHNHGKFGHSHTHRENRISICIHTDSCESHRPEMVLTSCNGGIVNLAASTMLRDEQLVTTDNKQSDPVENTLSSMSNNKLTNIDAEASSNQGGLKVSVSKVDEQTNQANIDRNISSFRSVLVIAALSMHGIFEGLSMGLEEENGDIWLLCAALTSHKIFIGFSIGMEFLETGLRTSMYMACIIIFSIASPLGSVIGMIALEVATESAPSAIAIPVLQGISSGTILYVTFCEVLERERSKPNARFFKLFSLLGGFTLIALLELVLGHEHDH